jgi:hypothetical protein
MTNRPVPETKGRQPVAVLTTEGRSGHLLTSVIVRRRAQPRYFPYRPFLTAGRFTAESRPGDEIEDYLSLGGLPRVVRTLWPTFLNPESDVCWEVSSNQGISDSPRLKLRLPKINQTQM